MTKSSLTGEDGSIIEKLDIPKNVFTALVSCLASDSPTKYPFSQPALGGRVIRGNMAVKESQGSQDSQVTNTSYVDSETDFLEQALFGAPARKEVVKEVVGGIHRKRKFNGRPPMPEPETQPLSQSTLQSTSQPLSPSSSPIPHSPYISPSNYHHSLLPTQSPIQSSSPPLSLASTFHQEITLPVPFPTTSVLDNGYHSTAVKIVCRLFPRFVRLINGGNIYDSIGIGMSSNEGDGDSKLNKRSRGKIGGLSSSSSRGGKSYRGRRVGGVQDSSGNTTDGILGQEYFTLGGGNRRGMGIAGGMDISGINIRGKGGVCVSSGYGEWVSLLCRNIALTVVSRVMVSLVQRCTQPQDTEEQGKLGEVGDVVIIHILLSSLIL